MFTVVQISVVGLCVAMIWCSFCPDGWTDAGGYCYNYTAGLQLPYIEAQANCAQSSGHIIVEVSADEHVVFVSYRQSMSQQGDPVWTGVYVLNSTAWNWQNDRELTKPLYNNWLNGKMPPRDPGRCAASNSTNGTEAWISMACTTPLEFICEFNPKNKGAPGGGYSFAPASYAHDWQKVYEDSIFQLPNTVVNANLARTRTLVSCAVMCTTVAGCLAFNHQRSNNTCQFILTAVNDTYIYGMPEWDVWIDMSQA